MLGRRADELRRAAGARGRSALAEAAASKRGGRGQHPMAGKQAQRWPAAAALAFGAAAQYMLPASYVLLERCR